MNDDADPDDPLDMTNVNAEIADGIKAYRELLDHAADDWTHWEITIRGLRALRTLAFTKSGSNNMHSQAYRDAMNDLLQTRKYAIYDQIDRQTRSDCYKLMDALDEIGEWYAGLSSTNKLNWKHPSSIAKHAPEQLLSGGMGHNKPKRKKKIVAKKPAVNAEIERLRQLLHEAIGSLVRYEPDNAKRLLTQVMPGQPTDELDDLFKPDPHDDNPGDLF
jgi:hypothetical protein